MTRYHKHLALRSKRTRLVDSLVYFAAIVEPILFLPQVYQIFKYRTAAGISIPTWLSVNVLTLVWVWYALIHRQRMIFIYQGLFFIINSLIILGALLYGGMWI